MDPAFWRLLRKHIDQTRANLLEGIVKGAPEREYLMACGRLQAYEDVLRVAADIQKRLNSGEEMEDVI